MENNAKNTEHTSIPTPPQPNEGNPNEMKNANYDYSYYNQSNGMFPMGSNNMYDASGKYLMNYNYVDPSYYSMNPNAMINMGAPMYPIGNQGTNSYNNSINMYQNNISEPYNYNNLNANINNPLNYNIQGNQLLNSFNQSVSSNFNNNNNAEDKKNIIEMTNTSTYNVNNLLRNNILSSEYFRSLINLKTFKEVLDEILSYADHVEPYCIGSTRAPSTLFCCLYKFFTMQLTKKQLKSLIDNKESCYVRACGFLYLRYVHCPSNLWMWFEPYMLDDDEFTISADKRKLVTIGEYVQSLLYDDKYFNTVLPRLPIKIKNIYGARLMLMSDHRKRHKKNKEQISKFVKGEHIMAYVNGEWEKGEIGGIVNQAKEKVFVRIRKIDGNEKIVHLGYVKLISKDSERGKGNDRRSSVERSKGRGRSRDRSRDRSRSRRRRRRRSRSRDRSRSRSRDRSRERRRRKKRSGDERDKSEDDYSRNRSSNRHSRRSRDRSHRKRDRSISSSESDKRGRHRKEKDENTEDELINKFRKIESQKALATGKDYARRPTSYKSSLTIKVENIYSRKKNRSISPKRIERPVQTNQNDKKTTENVVPENSKLKELMERYNKADNNMNRMNNNDLEEMDVMKLG
ncbi:pre-mRNA-splicing factor 38B, putative [Plasmodium chabaudi chabaudi]|uniref:Pre-mRNA-splicing factor 38B, putative n=1 Tax=Plasmodium chabaudi chabaudi TaxID=31271 RepID=A0A1C6XG84_PLACU|nr:pre-mRNA-splicing factor 38B, putative [Plasmodium chabaudi chabaudi]